MAFRDEFDERDEAEEAEGEDRFTGLSRLSAEGFELVGGLITCWTPTWRRHPCFEPQ